MNHCNHIHTFVFTEENDDGTSYIVHQCSDCKHEINREALPALALKDIQMLQLPLINE